MSLLDLPKDVLRVIAFQDYIRGRWASLAIFRLVCKRFAQCISLCDVHAACKKDMRNLPVVCVHTSRFVEDMHYHPNGMRVVVCGTVVDHEIRLNLSPSIDRLISRMVPCRTTFDIDTKLPMRATQIERGEDAQMWEHFIPIEKDPRYVRDCIVSSLLEFKHFGVAKVRSRIEDLMHESYDAYVSYLMKKDRKAKKLKG